MAKILIVDDNSGTRKLVVSLLSQEGHRLIEATDGADGLEAARAENPDLVISDILMPSMDGFEFVRRLRTDNKLRDVAVIFYTAHYHEAEARNLAEACRVARVIVRSNGAAGIVRAVAEVLDGNVDPPAPPLDVGFDREHLQLLTNKLAQKAVQLKAANARFAALTELNVQLASERVPRVLFEKVCQGARDLLGAKYAVLAVARRDAGVIFASSGVEVHGNPAAQPCVTAGLLGRVAEERRPWRVANPNGSPIDAGLPACYPAARAFLAAPVMSLTETFGWLCLADKVGAQEFTSEDELILAVLGAQSGRIYENSQLYEDVQRHAAQLQIEIDERARAAADLEHLNRVHAMLSGINSLIIRAVDRTELLREACRLAVENGRFRMAWCSWLEPETSQVTPVAWAGDSPELARALTCKLEAVADGETLIPAAMRLQQPIICDDLEEDSHLVPEARQMVERGYRAIVALPLVIEAQSVGCLVLVMDERGFFNAAEMRLLTELSGDISFALDHIKKAERLNYLAYYDSLTGLANRTFFYERLSQYVSAAARGHRKFALVIADMERFAAVNDTFGRHVGDELLRQVGERLISCVGDASEVARLGADQFATVIFDVTEISEIARTIDQWRQQWLGLPFNVEGAELRMSAKSGIALYPADGTDPTTLIRNAEAALKNAKFTSDRVLFYAPHLTDRAAETLTLENQLKRAIEQQQFVLYYQPKVDMQTRRLVGVEALMRWRNPDLGLVPPMKFIPLLEETGMIVEVGSWALRQASLDRGTWQQQGLRAPRVAVNVSTVQLQRSDFVKTVASVLELAGADPGLDIEVTESLIMSNPTSNIEKLRALRDLGVDIAIDDFGTGYSSLAYLTRLPAQTLKIDRSFVTAMLEDPGAMTLVSTIISLAHSLKLAVVAEGVESEEQAKFLRLLRCDRMQGYLISKPLSFEDMTAYLGD
jgi:diguanylate cyclase (GGDEF)-like protein